MTLTPTAKGGRALSELVLRQVAVAVEVLRKGVHGCGRPMGRLAGTEGVGVTISRKMLGGSRQSLALTRSTFSAGVRTRSPRGEIAIAVGISTASAKIAAAPRVSLPRGALAN